MQLKSLLLFVHAFISASAASVEQSTDITGLNDTTTGTDDTMLGTYDGNWLSLNDAHKPGGGYWYKVLGDLETPFELAPYRGLDFQLVGAESGNMTVKVRYSDGNALYMSPETLLVIPEDGHFRIQQAHINFDDWNNVKAITHLFLSVPQFGDNMKVRDLRWVTNNEPTGLEDVDDSNHDEATGLPYINTPRIRAVEACGTSKTISLTFDDGPELAENRTMILMDQLEAIGAVGTFFIAPAKYSNRTEDLEKRCDLVKNMVSRGHSAQSHSWTHPDFQMLTREEIIEELNLSGDWIEKCSGTRPRFFRPPHTALDEWQAKLITDMGYIVSVWNVDTEDWATPGNEHIIINNIEAKVADYQRKYGVEYDSMLTVEHDSSSSVLGKGKTLMRGIDEQFGDSYSYITIDECYDSCPTERLVQGTCLDAHFLEKSIRKWGIRLPGQIDNASH